MRDENLLPLTHDHHHTLAAIRRLRVAAHEEDSAQRSAAAGTFLDHFSSDTLNHFREEEEELFPLVVGHNDAREPLTRVMIEHVEIHQAVRLMRQELETGEPSATSMTGVAELLEAHIRFEEKVLFPLIEKLVGAEGLKEISLRPRTRDPVSRS
jgi:hemerythrin-like domain-containing protein